MKHKTKLNILILLSILTLLVSQTAFADWSWREVDDITTTATISDIYITHDYYPYFEMNYDEKGVLVSSRISSTNYEVLSYHLDTSFSEKAVSGMTDIYTEPRVSINDDGDIAIIYISENSSGTTYKVCSDFYDDSTGSWQRVYCTGSGNKISSLTTEARTPWIDYNNNGNAAAAWVQLPTSSSTTGDLYYSYYSDSSSSWITETIVDTLGPQPYYPQIIIDDSENILVAWTQRTSSGSTWSRLFTKSCNSFGSCSTASDLGPIDEFAGGNNNFYMAGNSSGNAVIVWKIRLKSGDTTSYVVKAAYLSSIGSSWGTTQTIISSTTDAVGNPRVAINENGDAVIIVEKQSTAAPAVYALTYDADTSSWGSRATLNTNTGTIKSIPGPVVAININQDIVVAYNQGSLLQTVIYTETDGWGTPTEIDGYGYPAGAGIDDDGEAVVVWTDILSGYTYKYTRYAEYECGDGILNGSEECDNGSSNGAESDCSETCTTQTDGDRDGYYGSYDCDDTNSAVSPGATETCNEVDDNCDGNVDEGVATNTFYQDADGDGYGLTSISTTSCYSTLSGYSRNSGDCDDADATVSPGATETCNEVDDDCDGSVDNGLRMYDHYLDADGDHYGVTSSSISSCYSSVSGYARSSGDCDDTTTAISPGVSERCNGIDDDCDGTADDGLEVYTYYLDADNDNFGLASSITTSCDSDLDGYSLISGDCDDTDADVRPGEYDACDGEDNDCDGSIDEDATFYTYYIDADEDGYGVDTTTTEACSLPSGYSTVSTDCDDTDASVNISETEICDGVDNDCDGSIDEGNVCATSSDVGEESSGEEESTTSEEETAEEKENGEGETSEPNGNTGDSSTTVVPGCSLVITD